MKVAGAVVGVGFVGRAHVEVLRRLGISVRGILGRTPERAKAAAATLALPPAYESLEELVADAEVRVVHICTPNHLHFQQAAGLLRAGKHVLCEPTPSNVEIDAAKHRWPEIPSLLTRYGSAAVTDCYRSLPPS